LLELERLVMEAGNHSDWSGREKFDYVKEKFLSEWSASIIITDRTLNMLIEIIYNKLVKQKLVRTND
jgi:hypothetical protein